MAGERKERGEIQTFIALLDRGAQAHSNLVLWGKSTVGGREAEDTRAAGWSCRSMRVGISTAPRPRGLEEFGGMWEEAALTVG